MLPPVSSRWSSTSKDCVTYLAISLTDQGGPIQTHPLCCPHGCGPYRNLLYHPQVLYERFVGLILLIDVHVGMLDETLEGHGPSVHLGSIVADTLRLNDDIRNLCYRRCQLDLGWLRGSSVQRGYGLAAVSSPREDSREEGEIARTQWGSSWT